MRNNWDNDPLLDHPVRTVLGFYLLVLLINLIFWGALIAGVLWGLNHYGVI